ncbi:MAG: hypothetical protein IJ115_08490 [Erysipelotrichaceae bacterium]|nr:hypothetical protein [Erysipelotrichaceae bacterium]
MSSFINKKKITWLVAGLIVILLIVLSGSLFKKRTLIVKSVSDDNIHTVSIYMVGDPEFPYGSTNCQAILSDNNKTVSRQDIILKNDGKTATEENFVIMWQNDKVIITAMAEEMEPVRYTVSFS